MSVRVCVFMGVTMERLIYRMSFSGKKINIKIRIKVKYNIYVDVDDRR